MLDLKDSAEPRVFAANRASSRIAVTVEASEGAYRPRRVREEGSLRVRFPGAPASLDALCRRFNIDLSDRVEHGAEREDRRASELRLKL